MNIYREGEAAATFSSLGNNLTLTKPSQLGPKPKLGPGVSVCMNEYGRHKAEEEKQEKVADLPQPSSPRPQRQQRLSEF
jgi:hypothetical protein